MKNTLLFLLILLSISSFSQPQGINYQGLARDASGNSLLNQNISLRLSILDSSATGTSVYVETQNVTTNNSGLFNLGIGTGSIVSGVFANIPWGQGDKWLKIEMDVTGGSNFQLIGTSQFLSVPYSLHSKSSETSANGMPSGTNTGDILYWNGTSWVEILVGPSGYGLALCNGIPTWGGCPINLTTTAVSSVSYTSAVSGGSITNNNGVNIIMSGVCYSTSPSPTINDGKTTDGSGAGIFASSMSGLTPNTAYYVRAYATHGFGTVYGNELSFTTLPLTIPTLITSAAGNISNFTTVSGGNISSDGGAAITAKGVCWSTTQNPTTANSFTNDGTGNASYTSNITGLTANTTYYARAYASNSQGTAYGNQISFTTIALALATVNTNTISSISYTTATGGGNVTSDGGTTVTTRGICWNTSQNPTTANSTSSAGSGTGSFTASLTGLTANTIYYVRAYATNSGGTSYGNEVSFTTLALTPPTVTTTVVNNISTNTAAGGGNVTDDGGSNVTARGICWSTLQNPTTADSKTNDGTGLGAYYSILSGLTLSSTYYVRAYATNSLGTTYGTEVSFTTLATIPPLQSLPIVGTVMVTVNTSTTATSGGYISFDGNSLVISRGVCWSTSPNPTTADNSTNNGGGTGFYVSTISFLFACNITYYLRAYTINSSGTGYGNQVTFIFTGYVPSGITTEAISNISSNSATSGGTVTEDGGCNAITARGVCWSLSPNPTISDSKSIDASGTGTYVSNLTGLLGSRTYYVRAYASNAVGTSYGNQQTFTTSAPTSFFIGQGYGGGFIFYLDSTGQHGLIAAPSDEVKARWGCEGTSIPGTSSAIGTGAQNTAAIIANCPTSGIAARICDDLVLSGYSDWFLPSKDELNSMYQNRAIIGGFSTNNYWSSSEYSVGHAWTQVFGVGSQYNLVKSNLINVRAVRAF